MKVEINKPFPSTRKFKKYDVYVYDDGEIKKISFGDKRYVRRMFGVQHG